MFCRRALIETVITAGPDETIADALALLDRHGIRALPIVDRAAGTLLGWFSFDVVLSNLLPGAVTVQHHGLEDTNLRLDYLVDTEERVAERLAALLPVRLSEVMDADVAVTYPETPLWEGIRLLFQHGSPMPVVDASSRRLLGLLSVQSAMCELARLVGQCGEPA
jgi:CBS domain-containing protein